MFSSSQSVAWSSVPGGDAKTGRAASEENRRRRFMEGKCVPVIASATLSAISKSAARLSVLLRRAPPGYDGRVKLKHVLLALLGVFAERGAIALEQIVVVPETRSFAMGESGGAFVPWGLNYGNAGRLMEDF